MSESPLETPFNIPPGLRSDLHRHTNISHANLPFSQMVPENDTHPLRQGAEFPGPGHSACCLREHRVLRTIAVEIRIRLSYGFLIRFPVPLSPFRPFYAKPPVGCSIRCSPYSTPSDIPIQAIGHQSGQLQAGLAWDRKPTCGYDWYRHWLRQLSHCSVHIPRAAVTVTIASLLCRVDIG